MAEQFNRDLQDLEREEYELIMSLQKHREERAQIVRDLEAEATLRQEDAEQDEAEARAVNMLTLADRAG